MKHTRKNQRGQNLVEFSLVALVLVVLILVIIDLGRITYTYSALHNAVREGARYGVIHPNDTSDIEDFARDYAIGLDQTQLTIVPVYNAIDETITVTGVYVFSTASPILSLLIDSDTFTLQAESRMLTEE